jgi:3'-phosphoadenosine 5'-phosphosulfate sulfotransferase (PAPS reductase)/FAD synthetase
MIAITESRPGGESPSGSPSCYLPSSSGISSLRLTGRVICWFSCGAASAVATKLAIEKYGTVEIYYTDTGSEHEDNHRFLAECEQWFGQKITTLKSAKYANIWEVFEKQRFLSSPQGAPCTGAMKKEPANGIWNVGDVEIFGYTGEESRRMKRWQRDNPERVIECPLIDKHLTKEDCFGMLARVGIALPIMYLLGFLNNNCIGCVKARDNINYWKRVRKYFPLVFWRIAGYERQFGFALNRVTRNGVKVEVYLDEIEDGDPTGPDTVKISCGLFCMAEADAMTSQDEEPDPMGDMIRKIIPNYNPTRYGYSEIQRKAAEAADEKPDGQADNDKTQAPT